MTDGIIRFFIDISPMIFQVSPMIYEIFPMIYFENQWSFVINHQHILKINKTIIGYQSGFIKHLCYFQKTSLNAIHLRIKYNL